jgi:regulatory protein
MPEKKLPPLRDRALGYLSRREYSRNELARKLAPYVEDAQEIHSLLDDFTQRGWLSEARFIDMVVQARQGKYGSRRIAHELREKGVSEEDMAGALSEARTHDLANARAAWRKKFGTPPVNAGEKAKQMRFLASRGFDLETLRQVVNGAWEEEMES